MDLRTTFAGVEFKNPIVTSAGSLGAQVASLERSVKAGAGAVTVKTPSLDKDNIKHPRPAHKFLRQYNTPRMMINWESFTISIDEALELVKRIKPVAKKHDCRLIASLGVDYYAMDHPAEFSMAAKQLEKNGAEILEIIAFCPFYIKTSAEELDLNERAINTTSKAAKEAVQIPVIEKVAYEYNTYFLSVTGALKQIGVKNLHVFTRTRGAIIDIETMESICPGPQTLFYGELRKSGTNRAVALASDIGGFELMSSGGLWTATDCLERMMCGAKLVAIHTALQYYGHKLIGELADGISKYLDRKRLTLDDIVGVAVPSVVKPEGYTAFIEERSVPKEALDIVVDAEKCNGCGICTKCINGAFRIENEKAIINLDLCERCGICESMCPTGAITIS